MPGLTARYTELLQLGYLSRLPTLYGQPLQASGRCTTAHAAASLNSPVQPAPQASEPKLPRWLLLAQVYNKFGSLKLAATSRQIASVVDGDIDSCSGAAIAHTINVVSKNQHSNCGCRM